MIIVFPVVVSAEPDELKFFLQDFEIEKEEVKGFARLFYGRSLRCAIPSCSAW